MKYATLSWVKPAIDDTLKLTRQSLEQFVENPDDTGPLQEAVGWLHEIHGALLMLEIDSAVMLLESMSAVTQGLLSNKIPDKGSAYDSLMRGVLQLPNYLDHLTLGYPPVPLALLPLINQLRGLVSEKPVAASSMFFPDVTLGNPQAKAVPKMSEAQFKGFVRQLRVSYQKGLVEFAQGDHPMEGLKLMLNTLNQAQQLTGTAPVSKVWWIGEALLESIAQKGLSLNDALMGLFKQVDGLLKPLMEQGTGALTRLPPAAWVTKWLFYAAQATSTGQRLLAVKARYQLDYCLPSAALLREVERMLSGPDIELMRMVVTTLRDELGRLEETLDIFMRTDHPEVSDLKPLVAQLRTAGLTLRLLGLETPAVGLLKQSAVVDAMVSRKIEASGERLLAMADLMLRVDAALETLSTHGTHAMASLQQPPGRLDTPLKDGIKAVVEEAKIELTDMMTPILSCWDRQTPDEEVALLPARFQQLGGVLLMLHQPAAAQLTARCALYVARHLLHPPLPSPTQRRQFAEVIVCLELLLDSLAGHPHNPQQLLASAQHQLQTLLSHPTNQ
ncbi:MAG: hypothetical protein RIT27_2333 [Pseudomonadota bacterium]